MEVKLASGQSLTYEELQEALLGALNERKLLNDTVQNMGGWISRLVTAYLSGDTSKLAETMAQLMKEHVKVIHAHPTH